MKTIKKLLKTIRHEKHQLNNYTVFHYGKYLKVFEITQFSVEITHVECWRLHSFSLWEIP